MENIAISDELEFVKKSIETKELSKGKMVGVVTLIEKDKDGNIISSETSHNQIVLPGSILSLEKLFNIGYDNRKEFIHPESFKLNSIDISLDKKQDIHGYDSAIQIFGFMVGNGGATSDGISSESKYSCKCLIDSEGNNSFIPIRITNIAPGSQYCMRGSDEPGNKYYFAKKYDSLEISVIDASTSQEISSFAQANSNVTTIITKAELTLELGEDDIKDYYSNIGSKYSFISQIGLVAGIPDNNTYQDYKSVQLITSYNFKERDFSNTGNTLTMIYRLYSM